MRVTIIRAWRRGTRCIPGHAYAIRHAGLALNAIGLLSDPRPRNPERDSVVKEHSEHIVI